MQVIRGDYGGNKTAIGYLRLCRVIGKRKKALKTSAQKERLYAAVATAEEEISIMRKSAVESVGEEHGEIYEIYLKILKNEALRGRLLSSIESGASSEEAIRTLLSEDSAATDGEFSQRHVKDCLSLLSKVLEDTKCPDVRELPKENENGSYIYVSDGDEPGELSALLQRFKKGSEKEPVGVICANANELRSAVTLEIPSLLISPDRLPDESFDGITAILDCDRRRLILDPDLSELEKYSEQGKKQESRLEELSRFIDARSVTPSGVRIHLFSEHLLSEDRAAALCRCAPGADNGLLISTDGIAHDSSEQYQYEIYRKLAEASADNFVRLFELSHSHPTSDIFPISSGGLCGAGLFALFRQVYKTQLKALLRSAAHGSLSVVLPCVSDRNELNIFRSIYREARSELKDDGTEFSEFRSFGIELATPAAALDSDLLCQGIELAVIDLDRLSALTSSADLRDPLASDRLRSGISATLKLCAHAIDTADKSSTRFAVRGSLASDPELTHLLIDCGFKLFFLDPENTLCVKEKVLSYREGSEQ